MKLGVLFSGGKDSCLAMYKASKEHDIKCLITIFSLNPHSYMFHTPNIRFTKDQAKAMDIPMLVKETKGEKEKELDDLKLIIKEAKEKYKLDGIVTGAVRSVYQASRVQKICDELNIWCFNPLWLKDQRELLKELVKEKFKVIISGVFAYPLDETFLGKEIDEKLIKTLEKLEEKYKLNVAGEGGEIETTVLDAPFFKKSLNVIESDIEYKNHVGNFIIKKLR